MTWIQPIKASPYAASLTGLWPLGLGLHQPLTRHAIFPPTLSGEGVLSLWRESKSLCYSPCSSELTPTGKRDICGSKAHYYGSSVTLSLTGRRPSPGYAGHVVLYLGPV